MTITRLPCLSPWFQHKASYESTHYRVASTSFAPVAMKQPGSTILSQPAFLLLKPISMICSKCAGLPFSFGETTALSPQAHTHLRNKL
jgi:hypothetical protein